MNEEEQEEDNTIPLFKSWNQWYVFVIGFLLALIILFKLLTNYFA